MIHIGFDINILFDNNTIHTASPVQSTLPNLCNTHCTPYTIHTTHLVQFTLHTIYNTPNMQKVKLFT